MTSRMRRNKIRDNAGTQPRIRSNLVEFLAQTAEKLERRLAHVIEDIVLSMLRSDLESAGRMVQNQFLQIRIGSLVHEAVFLTGTSHI